MAALIYYYSRNAFLVPYKLVPGLAVMLVATASYYLKPTLIEFGFTDLWGSFFLLILGLMLTGIITYKSILRSE
jgi:Flp pilus assembly protein TadB